MEVGGNCKMVRGAGVGAGGGDLEGRAGVLAVVMETARLVLREVGEGDAGFVLELLNDEAFVRYIGDRGVRDLEGARRYIAERMVGSYRREGFGMYVAELKEGGAAAGVCGLVRRDALPGVDVGFAFLPAHRGRGYAFEAASAVMEYARDVLKLPRVLAIVSPGNAASVRLLGRLGLKFERMVTLADDDVVELYAVDF